MGAELFRRRTSLALLLCGDANGHAPFLIRGQSISPPFFLAQPRAKTDGIIVSHVSQRVVTGLVHRRFFRVGWAGVYPLHRRRISPVVLIARLVDAHQHLRTGQGNELHAEAVGKSGLRGWPVSGRCLNGICRRYRWAGLGFALLRPQDQARARRRHTCHWHPEAQIARLAHGRRGLPLRRACGALGPRHGVERSRRVLRIRLHLHHGLGNDGVQFVPQFHHTLVAQLTVIAQRTADDRIVARVQPRHLVGRQLKHALRQAASEHVVEHHPDRIDVRPLIHRNTQRQRLRRDVVQRPHRHTALRHPRALPTLTHLRQAKVRHLHYAVIAHHDVRWLDVSVDDAALMRILQRIAHMRGDRHRMFSGQSALRRHHLRHIRAVHELHDDVEHAVARAAKVIHRHQAGVV